MKPFDIPTPCHEDWNQMRNDGASRHCASCDKSVHDLTKLTARQIAGLVLVSGGNFCGRQTIRGGEMIVASPPPVVRGSSIWPIRAAVLAGALSAAACAPASAKPPEPVATAPAEPNVQPTPKPPLEVRLDDVFEHNNLVMAGMIAYTPELPTEITFAHGKATLDKDMKDVVATAADFLSRHQPGGLLRIEGHASRAESKQPKRLALQRAEAVKKALIAAGVPRERLTTVGVERVVSAGDAALARTVTLRIEPAHAR